MRSALALIALLSATASRADLTFPAPPSPLVTGNGYGFAVYSLKTGEVTRLYAHPYRFMRPDPHDEWGEGIETTSFLKSLRWPGDAAGKAAYLRQSQIMQVSGRSTSQYFMPFGLERNALVAVGEGCLQFRWEHGVRAKTLSRAGGVSYWRYEFKDVSEQLLAVPLGKGRAEARADCLGGTDAWALVPIDSAADAAFAVKDVLAWRGSARASELVARELVRLEAWRVAAPESLSPAEREIWRQSEVILRMAQSREPDTAERHGHGLILASLPEGMWFVSWVRDMAFATVALARMGHYTEARWALEAYFAARRVGRLSEWTRGLPYQVSAVRYFGDGTEEPFFTMEGYPNVELDGWGLVLWALSEYVERSGDADLLRSRTWRGGTLYESARDFVATPLLGNVDPTPKGAEVIASDTSIWEEPQDQAKHFAFTTGAAIRGLEGFKGLAERMGDRNVGAWTAAALGRLRAGFGEAFVRDGFIHGTWEDAPKNDVDAAVLETIAFGAVTDHPVIAATLQQLELLRMPTGGFRRVRGDTEYEKHEFVYSDVDYARVALGQRDFSKANSLIAPIVDRITRDSNLVPEMYLSRLNPDFAGQIGDPTGSIPMVGYGAGIAIIYWLEREAAATAAHPAPAAPRPADSRSRAGSS